MTDSKSIVSNFFKVQTRKLRCDESHWGQLKYCLSFLLSRAGAFYEEIDKFRWRDWPVGVEFYYLQDWRGKTFMGHPFFKFSLTEQ